MNLWLRSYRSFLLLKAPYAGPSSAESVIGRPAPEENYGSRSQHPPSGEAPTFLFLCVGVWWIIQAFLTKAINSMWWIGLIAGILMVALGFWTSGQFFLQRAYTLLVFAGIWALMQGIIEIVRAFQIRALREVS
jgi:Short repeat of unknown function (DUF308)